MLRPRQWRLSASAVSSSILRGSLKFAVCMGIVWFSVRHDDRKGRLVAKTRVGYKWICLTSRILISGIYSILYLYFVDTLTVPHLITIVYIRLLICILCGAFTFVVQFWFGQGMIDLVNRFFRLFQRVKALPGCQGFTYGGLWVTGLLLVKIIGLAFENIYLLPDLFLNWEPYYVASVLGDIYINNNISVILYAYFVAYLSIGILFDQVNSFIRHELRQELEGLKNKKRSRATRKEVRTAAQHLDEVLEIYENIHEVGVTFNRFFEYPICIILLFGFISIAAIFFFIALNHYGGFSLYILGIKVFSDILLVTVAIYIASNNSRLIRRLGFENYYLCEDKEWHMKLEMFLGRLNHCELRVRPLGLFEVSNELVLVFLSGLVTYLTYIIQYSLKSNLQ